VDCKAVWPKTKKNIKKKLKQVSTVQVHIPWRQSKENQQSMEERRRLRFVNKS